MEFKHTAHPTGGEPGRAGAPKHSEAVPRGWSNSACLLHLKPTATLFCCVFVAHPGGQFVRGCFHCCARVKPSNSISQVSLYFFSGSFLSSPGVRILYIYLCSVGNHPPQTIVVDGLSPWILLPWVVFECGWVGWGRWTLPPPPCGRSAIGQFGSAEGAQEKNLPSLSGSAFANVVILFLLRGRFRWHLVCRSSCASGSSLFTQPTSG